MVLKSPFLGCYLVEAAGIIRPSSSRAAIWWRRRELFVLRPHPFGAAVAALPRCLATAWLG